MRFKNKEVAIVTGGSKSIGAGISRVLAKEGCIVVIADIAEKEGKEVVKDIINHGGEAIFIRTDVSKEKEMKSLMSSVYDKYGRLNILINNAGIGGFKRVTDTSMEDWETCMNVDLKGVYLGCRFGIPYMEKTGKGSIVNISSVHALKSVNANAAYDAAKGAVSALTRQVAIDYGPTVRVNDISPGWVHSNIVKGIFDSYDDPAAAQKEVEEKLLTKFIGTGEDIGNACAFLCSDEARYITGTQLVIDGGLSIVLERW